MLVSAVWKIHDSAMASPSSSDKVTSGVTSGVIDLTGLWYGMSTVVPIPSGTVIDLTAEAESCDGTTFECGGKRKADTDEDQNEPALPVKKRKLVACTTSEEEEDEDEDDDDYYRETELKYGGNEELIVEVFNVVGNVYRLCCFVKYEDLCEDDVAFLVENYDMCDIPLESLPGFSKDLMYMPCDWITAAYRPIRTPSGVLTPTAVIRIMQYENK